MKRMFAKSVDRLFGNIIFAMRSPRYTDMTPQSEVVRDDPIGRTPPLSTQGLCKRAQQAIFKRIYAMERGLDYKTMTPQSEEEEREERLASLKQKKCST